MESEFHPEEPDSSDAQHLFDQLDAIVDSANATEMNEAIAEAEHVAAQYERQMDVLAILCDYVDPAVAAALHGFYDEPSGDGARTLAFEVAGYLNGMLEDPELTPLKESQILFMIGLNDVLIETSIGQLEQGRFVPTYPKADAQLNVIEQDAFDPDTKAMLLEFIDDVMPGESLAYGDPEAVSRAIGERDKWIDEIGSRRQRGTIVEAEFSRFRGSYDDPEYASFIGFVKMMVNTGIDPVSVEDSYKSDNTTLRLLGISQDEYVASIRSIYARIGAIQ